MFLANLSESKQGTCGQVDKMSSGMGSRSTSGRLSGSLRAESVASSPGATESPYNANRVVDDKPKLTNEVVLRSKSCSPRCAGVVSCGFEGNRSMALTFSKRPITRRERLKPLRQLRLRHQPSSGGRQEVQARQQHEETPTCPVESIRSLLEKPASISLVATRIVER